MDRRINIREEKGTLVVSSREVAKNFGKEHYNLVRDIENLIKKNPLAFEGLNYFIKTTFKHRGNEYKKYLLTRGGLSLLTMGFTGSKALEWKIKYIEAFEKRITEIIIKVKELENSVTVTYEESEEIKKLANRKIMILLQENIFKGAKIYNILWKDYENNFNITNYHNTLKKDFEQAKEFIEKWKPTRGETYE